MPDQTLLGEYLALDTDDLLREAGKIVLQQLGTSFASPPSATTEANAGKRWWNRFRAKELCPAIHADPTLKALLLSGNKTCFP